MRPDEKSVNGASATLRVGELKGGEDRSVENPERGHTELVVYPVGRRFTDIGSGKDYLSYVVVHKSGLCVVGIDSKTCHSSVLLRFY
jgi:hypothetical protein